MEEKMEKLNEEEKLRILYENALNSSNAQDKRKENIDQKVSWLLTLTVALLALIVEFFDIEKVFTGDLSHMTTIITSTSLFLVYAASIIICLVIISRYIFILIGKEYRVIESKMFIAKEVRSKSYKDILNELAEEYEKNSESNSRINAKLMRRFDSNTWLLFANVIISTVLYIFLKMM